MNPERIPKGITSGIPVGNRGENCKEKHGKENIFKEELKGGISNFFCITIREVGVQAEREMEL